MNTLTLPTPFAGSQTLAASGCPLAVLYKEGLRAKHPNTPQTRRQDKVPLQLRDSPAAEGTFRMQGDHDAATTEARSQSHQNQTLDKVFLELQDLQEGLRPLKDF